MEDIGLYKRSDLETSARLKAVFRDIRLAHQIINVLFCKIYDETTKGPAELVEFRAGVDESARTVRDRLLNLFTSVKTRCAGRVWFAYPRPRRSIYVAGAAA